MLQKQTPSSNIPRFNPHGYQPPPVEKKKETTPKMSASMKFGAIKKRKEEEEIVDFKKFNIEDLLLDAVSKVLPNYSSKRSYYISMSNFGQIFSSITKMGSAGVSSLVQKLNDASCWPFVPKLDKNLHFIDFKVFLCPARYQFQIENPRTQLAAWGFTIATNSNRFTHFNC